MIIRNLMDEDKTIREIWCYLGEAGYSHCYANVGKKVRELRKNRPAPQATVRELTPRERIKKLYDLGYRIKDNKLVFIQAVEVKLQDIING